MRTQAAEAILNALLEKYALLRMNRFKEIIVQIKKRQPLMVF